MGISELIAEYGGRYLESLLVTWSMTAIAFSGAFVLGVLVTVMRVCPIKPLRVVGDFYVQVFRNIPGAALLIVLAYALPYVGLLLPYYTCVVVAVILIPSAFCSENLMSGINTIGVGQIEAARSLGMPFAKIIGKIVIPQALRSTVLPMTNLLILTMLTTSLASQVPLSTPDLTGLVSRINTSAVGGIAAFAISAVLYCGTAIVIGQLGNLLDKKVRILR